MNKHLQNKLAWDQAAESYKQGIPKSIELLKNGGTSFCKPEKEFFSNLSSWCAKAVHLQCAGGTDTLSLLNHGAKEVVGIDISDKMISVASEKSKILEANAKWLVSDVLELPNELFEQFDLVYTGQGALNWIMDLRKWSQTVYSLLNKGGKLFLFEGHPLTYMFDMDSNILTLDSEFKGYFSPDAYVSQGWTESYVGMLGKSEAEHNKKFERAWPTSKVIQSLLDTGLALQKFEEYPLPYWEEFPNLPDSEREKFPNSYSLYFKKL